MTEVPTERRCTLGHRLLFKEDGLIHVLRLDGEVLGILKLKQPGEIALCPACGRAVCPLA